MATLSFCSTYQYLTKTSRTYECLRTYFILHFILHFALRIFSPTEFLRQSRVSYSIFNISNFGLFFLFMGEMIRGVENYKKEE